MSAENKIEAVSNAVTLGLMVADLAVEIAAIAGIFAAAAREGREPTDDEVAGAVAKRRDAVANLKAIAEGM